MYHQLYASCKAKQLNFSLSECYSGVAPVASVTYMYISLSLSDDMWHLYLSFSEMGCKENLVHTQSRVFSYLDFKILCFQAAEKEKILQV